MNKTLLALSLTLAFVACSDDDTTPAPSPVPTTTTTGAGAAGQGGSGVGGAGGMASTVGTGGMGMGGAGGIGVGGMGGAGGSPPTYTVSVDVMGTLLEPITLELNATENLPANSTGTYTFSTELADGASYEVTIQQGINACTVTNGTGTIASADVDDVTVNCIVN